MSHIAMAPVFEITTPTKLEKL